MPFPATTLDAPVAQRQLPVGARTHPDIVAELPVVAVVSTLAALLRPGRHLVTSIAGRSQQCTTGLVHGPQCLVIRDALRRCMGKGGVGLYGELIPGQVGRAKFQGLTNISGHTRGVLTGKTEHQVQVDAVESCLPGGVKRCHRVAGRMNAAESGELSVVETLHADGQPIDASLPISGEMPAVHRSRVGLQGNLRPGFEADRIANPFEQSPQRGSGYKAGSASTEKNRDRPAPGNQGCIYLEVAQHRVDVGGLVQTLRDLVGVEIAVRTLPQTPGKVHIKGERDVRYVHWGQPGIGLPMMR